MDNDLDRDVADLKIMVIDDSKTIRRTAELLLKSRMQRYDGNRRIRSVGAYCRWSPGCHFVDIMMPRLDGYQTCAPIKNSEEFKHTPVIMLSSKTVCLIERARRIVDPSST